LPSENGQKFGAKILCEKLSKPAIAKINSANDKINITL